MSKLLLSVLIAIMALSGCTREIEVTKRLPIFKYDACKKPKRMKLGETIVMGFDADITITESFLGNNTLVILPFTMDSMNFNETIYLYAQSELNAFIKCYINVLATSDKNIAVLIDNNKKAPSKKN